MSKASFFPLPILLLSAMSTCTAPVLAADSYSWGTRTYVVGSESLPSSIVIEPVKGEFPIVARVTIFNGQNNVKGEEVRIITVDIDEVSITLESLDSPNLDGLQPDLFEVIDITPGYAVDQLSISVEEDQLMSFDIYAIGMM